MKSIHIQRLFIKDCYASGVVLSTRLVPVHSVHFYDDHKALIDRLCGVVCSGLLIGNSVVLVATEQHRLQLVDELRRLGVEGRQHARQNRFVMYDAEQKLATFMVEGLPDTTLFRASVGKLLAEAKKAARSQEKGLTVFGEMVAVLWEQGNRTGALALERIWNELLHDNAFHLHCAYARSGFHRSEDMQ